jgi:hypothetical protein
VQHLAQLEWKWATKLQNLHQPDHPSVLSPILEAMMTPEEVLGAELWRTVRLGCTHTLLVSVILRLLKCVSCDHSFSEKVFCLIDCVLQELLHLCLPAGESRTHMSALVLQSGHRMSTSNRPLNDSVANCWSSVELVTGTLAAGQLLAMLLEVKANHLSQSDALRATDVWYGLFLFLKYPMAMEHSERAVMAQINSQVSNVT